MKTHQLAVPMECSCHHSSYANTDNTVTTGAINTYVRHRKLNMCLRIAVNKPVLVLLVIESVLLTLCSKATRNGESYNV